MRLELLKNTIIVFLGKIFTQVTTFLLLPLYTYYLTAEKYGTIDLIITYIALIVPIIIIQLDAGVFRFLIDARENKEKQKIVISSVFHTILKIIISIVFLYVILNGFINFKYQHYIVLCIITNIISSFLFQISRGLGDNIKYAIGSIIGGIVTIIFNVILIIGFELEGVGILITNCIAHLAISIYLFISLDIRKKVKWKLKDKKLNKEIIKYSAPLIPNAISWWIVNISDRTIVMFFMGAAANGIYAISNKFPQILAALLGIYMLTWTESAALYINSEERDKFFSDTIDKSIRFFSSIAMGIVVCVPFVFPLLINSEYYESYTYIPILILAGIFSIFTINYSAILIAKKLTKKVMITTFISAVINIILNIIFIEKFGLYAASISTVISYLIMCVYRGIDIKKHVKVKYDIKIISTVFIMFAVISIIYYQQNFVMNIINLVIAIIVSLVLNRKIINLGIIKFLSTIHKKV